MRGAGGALYPGDCGHSVCTTAPLSEAPNSPPIPLFRGASAEDVVGVLDPVVAAIIPVLVDDFACEVAVHLTRRELRMFSQGVAGCSVGWKVLRSGLTEAGWEFVIVEFVIVLIVADHREGCCTWAG